MDKATAWYLILGLLFTMMGAFQYALKRLPLTTAMIYLPIGFLLGQHGFGLLVLDPNRESAIIERIAEIVVIVSLFTAGLKLRSPLTSRDWAPVLRLATLSMFVSISLLALLAHYVFGFSLGAAVLVGAILAPTDPVLASDVQLRGPEDRDPLRFSLTGEAGLNDGTAFPFVLLGLGILGFHDLGQGFAHWIFVDVLWQGFGGLAVGASLGTLVARWILYLRAKHKDTLVLDDFLTVGLICLSYSVSLVFHVYGFLAVFAAGLALRRTERTFTTSAQKAAKGSPAEIPSAKLAKGVLDFNVQLERLGEVSTVILVGALLDPAYFWNEDLLLVVALLLIVRPLSVWAGFLGMKIPRRHRIYISWFGIRGIGSIYYLSFVVSQGVPDAIAQRLIAVVLAAVSISILVHGLSVTPLMELYQERTARLRNRRARTDG